MSKQSIWTDLRRPEFTWNLVSGNLPENLTLDSGETCVYCNLPDISIDANFLVMGNVWAGISVPISERNIVAVKEWFRVAFNPRIHFISPKEAAALIRYSRCPGYWYLEVSWSDITDARVIEAMTNGVAWYKIQSGETKERIAAMGLDSIDYMLVEPDIPMQLPQQFPSGWDDK